MSTDRELLEMAAKAAGVDAEWYSDDEASYWAEHEGMWLRGARTPDNDKCWNPLRKDADAFRLLRQVDYGLLVEDGVVKIMNNLGGCQFFTVIENTGDIDDEMKIIRWAVVNAAAIKGRLMP